MNIGIDHGYYAIKTRRLAGFRPASSQSDRSTACVGWLPSRTIS